MAKIRYAKGPVIYLYDRDNLKTKKKQLLWGDWLRIGDDINADWSEIRWGINTFAIKKKDYQEQRLLEMIFLDVGQGDGCILTTPHAGNQEKIMLVDAGIGDNMKGYLEYRFRDFKKKFKFHAAIATHPDSDHYRGFQKVFENEQISFQHVYHNGLMERTGADLLGPVEDGFLTDIRASRSAAKKLYSNKDVRGGKWFPQLMWTALNSDRFDDVSMLSTEHCQKEDGRSWMPGFGPSDHKSFTIEVLGPVVEKAPNGKKGLRTFAKTMTAKAMDNGKTKNGHSVILRLQYHDFSVLFGGDLNTPAEHFLMRHYGNDGEAPTTMAESNEMIEKARSLFNADMMKCCHHGASDVTDEFLEATAPAAYVVSSGDEESHVHPRPDLLGLLGKKGRGARPLVLCTEILRSSREKESPELRKKLDKLVKQIATESDAEKKKALEKERSDVLDDVFKRNVGVYGAINLRTDGESAVIAFRREKPRGVSRWFYYELVKDINDVFQVKNDHAH
ncbi:ComEC/Rec2 family competence protein [Marinicella sp. W31]|uniref:ComEC/Rec2 family competence protein n=1 Tax=Marinicella sp. W31 TaxID=3023713 RepID=UPI003758205F